MMEHDSQRAASIQHSISVLQQTLDKLENHDYETAQIMIGVVVQILSEVQSDLNQQLSLEQKLRKLIN